MTTKIPDSNAARARILGSIRSGLGATGPDNARKAAVAERLAKHSRNLTPARALKPHADLVSFFRELLQGQGASVVEIDDFGALPTAIADYLRSKNLPQTVRLGADPLWQSLPWDREPALERTTGKAAGTDTAGLSHAIAAIAETGTLVLTSGADNPTTINYLPETHMVVVREADIVGAAEEMWQRLRRTHGEGRMPRAVNFVSGPSRTADIEQQLVMGAHGPRRLHVMILKG